MIDPQSKRLQISWWHVSFMSSMLGKYKTASKRSNWTQKSLISIRQWHETNDLDLSNWWSLCHIWSGMHVSLVLKTKTARVVVSCQIFLKVNSTDSTEAAQHATDLVGKGFDSLDERKHMKWHIMPLHKFLHVGFVSRDGNDPCWLFEKTEP